MCSWLIEVMFIEYKSRGGSGTKPCFSKPQFKPEWWPEEMWPWATVKHFKRHPKAFPGPGTLIEFLKHCAQLALASK